MDDYAASIADAGTFRAVDDGLTTRDPLSWAGYRDALRRAGAPDDEAVIAGSARVDGIDVELALFRFEFMGGSMGEVAGERLARTLERAATRGVPMILRTASGGARMQEGMVSLVQMPKLVSARRALADAHRPLVVVLGNPTTGGVLASIAALADFTVAETNATIGFAGPRIAERFTGEPVGRESHTAEGAWSSGSVDAIATRSDARSLVATFLRVLGPDDPADHPVLPRVTEAHGDAWEAVTRARSPERPTGKELIRRLTASYVSLHGDRAGSDDPALAVAIGRIGGRRAVLVALDRSHPPGPSAFRKARRCIALAERLDLPLVSLIDTPGADPSAGAEASGIAWAIAETFDVVLQATVPVLAVVCGEGGSGGALALACGDRLLAASNSVFSVIAPEAAAEILWRDPDRAADAAQRLRLSATDMVALGIADALVPDPADTPGFADAVAYHLGRLVGSPPPPSQRAAARRKRWRNVGNDG